MRNHSDTQLVQQPADDKLLSQNDVQTPTQLLLPATKWKVELPCRSHHTRLWSQVVQEKSDSDPSHPPQVAGKCLLKLAKTVCDKVITRKSIHTLPRE